MAVGPIPYSKIRWFGQEHGLSGYELNVFEYVIRALDTVQLKHLRTKQDKSTSAKS